MKKRKYKLEWYVLNGDFNQKKIVPFNIFQNGLVYESTCMLLDKYYAGQVSLADFTDQLDRTIKWQEWGRTEYEVTVNDLWGAKQKIDCWYQAHLNIDAIAAWIIEQNKHTHELDPEMAANSVKDE